jgi:putative transposase
VARIAPVVVPDLPHHVTQRVNRREPVFFEADDYRLYRLLVAAAARRARTAVWAYYLMPNHVHLIVTPAVADGLRATFAEARRRYTGAIQLPAVSNAEQRNQPWPSLIAFSACLPA